MFSHFVFRRKRLSAFRALGLIGHCLLLTGRRNARLGRAMMGHLLLVERHKANEVGLANTIL
jgi:hypothetical protein